MNEELNKVVKTLNTFALLSNAHFHFDRFINRLKSGNSIKSDDELLSFIDVKFSCALLQ